MIVEGSPPNIRGLLGSGRDDGVCCSLHVSVQDIAGQADRAWHGCQVLGAAACMPLAGTTFKVSVQYLHLRHSECRGGGWCTS